jgi:hypothetical protein
MKFPESVLLVGAVGCIGRRDSVRMDRGQRQVLEDIPDLITVGGQDLAVGLGMVSLAVRAFIIAEFNDRDRGVCAADDRVILVDPDLVARSSTGRVGSRLVGLDIW